VLLFYVIGPWSPGYDRPDPAGLVAGPWLGMGRARTPPTGRERVAGLMPALRLSSSSWLRRRPVRGRNRPTYLRSGSAAPPHPFDLPSGSGPCGPWVSDKGEVMPPRGRAVALLSRLGVGRGLLGPGGPVPEPALREGPQRPRAERPLASATADSRAGPPTCPARRGNGPPSSSAACGCQRPLTGRQQRHPGVGGRAAVERAACPRSAPEGLTGRGAQIVGVTSDGGDGTARGGQRGAVAAPVGACRPRSRRRLRRLRAGRRRLRRCL
jgi:hypothetical protein